ncbi:MAG TPA: hypothetical protein VFQ39_10675 [Longimicrobium sp.]|nr:hypothetical protein [Longimicrobium sp.]
MGMILALAACGGGGDTIAVRGDFAGDAPAMVRAEEAALDARVDSLGTFALEGLSAGPATLLLLRGGDTVGRLEISGLPAGTELALHGLRVDPASGRAFPRTVEPKGVGVVTVNGVRMAAPGRIPERLDEAGVVLGFAREAGALLFRPDDGAVPDLRVVLSPATESITPDGDPVPLDGLAPGDSVRVLGRAEEGFVIAERLTVPRRLALTRTADASSDEEESSSSPERSVATSREGEGRVSSSTSTSSDPGAPARAVRIARPPTVDRRDVREPRGKARGHERARGGGNGNGGKKPKG